MKLKVLFVTQEISPYLPETEMSTIGRFLPQGIQERDKEIRTFLPKFGSINERRNQLHEVIRLSGMNLIINDTDYPLVIKVASIQPARMQIYFIDNEDFFSRKHTLTNKGDEFSDNDERAIFYSRGVIETVKKLGWAPDIIHCHGWFTALVPFYMRKIYANDPLFDNNYKVIYSVYNDEFNQPLDPKLSEKIAGKKIPSEDVSLLSNTDWESLTKFAIEYSDGVIMGSNDIKESIKEHIKSCNKPYLTAQHENNYVDCYNDFYDKLIEEKITV
ncbi:glycogen/starch synthase [Bacteroidales bacterium OttesenSCG-928-I21]|nr:glycogen/starch synthase [Bacteroidales bacterium OttesenSCG-928-I21]